MKTNQKLPKVYTHEGGVASHIKPIDELCRTVMACLLWEKSFYEDGEAVADRIKRLVPLINPHDVVELAVETRTKGRLRHVPLLLMRELARDPKRCAAGLIASGLERVVQRADELSEFMSLYWAEVKAKDLRKRTPVAKQVKLGLAKAFLKFNEYQLAKYNRDGAVKLRDVLFLVHAKPDTPERTDLWKRLVEGKLVTPDTWEVALSAGEDKGAAFARLISDGKLGYMALLRNLRNMHETGVDTKLVFKALLDGAKKAKALPFRYVAAARAVPAWESQIDEAMQLALQGQDRLSGKTAVLVDVSGSMSGSLSAKSDLTRLDAAAALAVLVRGIADECRVFTFDTTCKEVPARKGMALVDAIGKPRGGTHIGGAVTYVNGVFKDMDRMIVITDEQSYDKVGKAKGKGYMINVAAYQRGVGYGDWTKIDGFSESVVQYIQQLEGEKVNVNVVEEE